MLKILFDYFEHSGYTNSSEVKISQEEFNNFCKEFVFMKLRGSSLGREFCKKYRVYDWLLFLSEHDRYAVEYITRYYIKNDISSN